MNNSLPRLIVLTFIFLLSGFFTFFYFNEQHLKRTKADQLASILTGEPALVLDKREKNSGCFFQGALPDHKCTPGSVFADSNLEKICISGYTKTVRKVSVKLRKAVFKEYGFSYPQPRGAFEVDHLIPLGLGGNNDIANLFPQPAAPAPGFREKDVVENFLRQEVCAGRVSLAAAQKQIANNWLAIYENMTPEQIKLIKNKFRNWSE